MLSACSVSARSGTVGQQKRFRSVCLLQSTAAYTHYGIVETIGPEDQQGHGQVIPPKTIGHCNLHSGDSHPVAASTAQHKLPVNLMARALA